MDRAELSRLLGRRPSVAEPRDVVVAETDPVRFGEAFADAVAAGGRVFLADPHWGEAERAQFNSLIAAGRGCLSPGNDRGWLAIPTGGSSGNLKLAMHDEITISAAVRGFAAHFSLSRVSALGVLPLHHVSGFMAWMRCVLTGGEYRHLATGDLGGAQSAVPEGAVLSLVPTQLARMLEDDRQCEWLRRFRAVFIGGAPSWSGLIERAAEKRLPLSFGYGSTETAAMVAAMRPEEFWAGMRGCGPCLPHARVMIGAGGQLRIEAESLFYGYYPEVRLAEDWIPGDHGRIDDQGSLHIHGRADALIMTGGEKVNPVEVEEALRGTGFFADIAVLGLPDPVWGQAVTAFYPAGHGLVELSEVKTALSGRLAAFKFPKRLIAVDPWPRNAQGKINREALRKHVGR